MKCRGCGKHLLGEEEICSECRLREKVAGAQPSADAENPTHDIHGAPPGEGAAPEPTLFDRSLRTLYAALIVSVALFVFLFTAYLVRSPSTGAVPVVAPISFVVSTPEPMTPTPSPPTPIPSRKSATVSGQSRDFTHVVGLVSADDRCLEVAFLSRDLSSDEREALSARSSLLRATAPQPSLIVRVNFATPTKICSVGEMKSYVLLFNSGVDGFSLPGGLARLESFRAQTWGRAAETVALECDQLEEHSVRGMFRGSAQVQGAALSWDLPFWGPLVQSSERFCGTVVPE